MNLGRINWFPPNCVWIPTGDGKFAGRPITMEDRRRRELVFELLTRPEIPRKMPQEEIDELMVGVNERKKQIRAELEQMRWPCHE